MALKDSGKRPRRGGTFSVVIEKKTGNVCGAWAGPLPALPRKSRRDFIQLHVRARDHFLAEEIALDTFYAVYR